MCISAKLHVGTIGLHTLLARGVCTVCSIAFCCASSFQLSPQPLFVPPHAAFCPALCSILVGRFSWFSAAIRFVFFLTLLYCLLLRLCFYMISFALIVSFARHVLATPRTSVSWAVSIIIANVWCIYGLSCLSSMIVARKNAIMLAVVLCMIPAALCVCLVFLSRQLSREAWRVTRFTGAATGLLSTKLQNGTSSGFSMCDFVFVVLSPMFLIYIHSSFMLMRSHVAISVGFT